MDYNSIINDIENHIENNGVDYRNWYVGIAKDPKDRLFNDHNVPEKNHAWIYRKVDSVDVARSVEKYFIEQHHTDGAPGGGDELSKFVYAYKKASFTNP